MKVLVTGSAGFLGSAMTERLRSRNVTVLGVDCRAAHGRAAHADDCIVDLTDAASLRRLIDDSRPDYLINFAARTDLSRDRVVDYRANIDGVANLLHAVREVGTVQRGIWVSTQLVSSVGRVQASVTDYRPDTTYGDSKVVGERFVRALNGGGAEWVIVRPTTVWGPGMSDHYLSLLKYLKSGRYFHAGAAPVYKSFSFIHNATYQIEKLLLAPLDKVHGSTFYLADYEPIEIRNWCDALARALGASPAPTVPVSIAKILAGLGDFLNVTVAPGFKFNSFRLRNMLTPYVFDLSELQAIVGELPHSFADSVRLTAQWYENKMSIPSGHS